MFFSYFSFYLQYFCASRCHLLKVVFFFIHYQQSASLSILHFSHCLYDLHIFSNFYVIYLFFVFPLGTLCYHPLFPPVFLSIYLPLILEHLIILFLLFLSFHSPFFLSLSLLFHSPFFPLSPLNPYTPFFPLFSPSLCILLYIFLFLLLHSLLLFSLSLLCTILLLFL